MTSLLTEPTQVWLEITPEIQTSAQEQCQPVTRKGGCWRVYVNHLCLKTVLAWVHEEYDPNAVPMHQVDENPVLWEMVTGSGIELADKRFIFIPGEGTGQDELRVPREWVDLPSWKGDYYFAVNVDQENDWVEVWGYATHQQLKQQGSRDDMERQYSLDASALTRQLYVLQALHQLQLEEATQAELEPVAQPEEQQANNLIQRLARTSEIFPRLSVPFSHWGELLENGVLRERLCQLRWTAWKGEPLRESEIVTRLRQLLQEGVELAKTGWQNAEIAFARGEDESIQSSVQGNSSNTSTPVSRAKVIDFSPNLPEQTLIFLMQLQDEGEGQLTVRLQLWPPEGMEYLPENTELRLLSPEQQVLDSVSARRTAKYIQVPRFRLSEGDGFTVEIELDGHTTTEKFIA